MQHVPEFLRSVEARLRCPAERRPAVIEELRGHLADRVDALVQQGLATPDAERRAVREMGAVWLLALRLSAANASNMTGYPALVGLVLGLIYGGLLALCLLLLNLPWFVGLGVALLGGLAATPLIRLVFGRLVQRQD